MTLFDDTGMAPDSLSEMAAATATLPQLPALVGCSLVGLLPPRLRFGTEEKPAGALPRWLVSQQQSAVVMRGHLLNAVAQSTETAMRRAEEQAGVPGLKQFTGRIVAHAIQWTAANDDAHRYAAEYALTIAALWHITTPAPGHGSFEQASFDAYLAQVPDAVRPQVAQRLQGIYQDRQAQPRGTYLHSDAMRRYWWALYGLLNIRDNVALHHSFVSIKPYLVLDDEAAWDLLYQTIADDEQMRGMVLALTDFYQQMLGVANAPGCADYLRGAMELGRDAAVTFAREHNQPHYNADSMGLGRSLLPMFAVRLDATADTIRQHEMTDEHTCTPSEFAQMMAAHRLLLGTDYSRGMIHITEQQSCLEQLMLACQQTFIDAEQPDSRDLADFMALAVAGLSTVDLSREVPGQLARSFPTYGLCLEARITPQMLETVDSTLATVQATIDNLGAASGHAIDIGNALTIRDAMPLLTQMSESPMAVPDSHPDFVLLIPLDQGCQPYATIVFSIAQIAGQMQMSWLTVPALVQMELEVMGTPTQVYGVTMLPFQGVVPRVLHKGEIDDALVTLLPAEATALQGNITPATPEVAYHHCLVNVSHR